MNGLPASWDEYWAEMEAYYGPGLRHAYDAVVGDAERAEQERLEQIASGQLRTGGPGDWYATFHWGDQAWRAIRPGRLVRLI
jgi:hypothetical protein